MGSHWTRCNSAPPNSTGVSHRADVKVSRLHYLKQCLAHGHMLRVGAANQREVPRLTPAYSHIQSCGLWTSTQSRDSIDKTFPTPRFRAKTLSRVPPLLKTIFSLPGRGSVFPRYVWVSVRALVHPQGDGSGHRRQKNGAGDLLEFSAWSSALSQRAIGLGVLGAPPPPPSSPLYSMFALSEDWGPDSLLYRAGWRPQSVKALG